MQSIVCSNSDDNNADDHDDDGDDDDDDAGNGVDTRVARDWFIDCLRCACCTVMMQPDLWQF